MDSESLKEFKESFKKKPESEKKSFKNTKAGSFLMSKKAVPYLIVFVGFSFTLFFTLVMIDLLVIPAFVNNVKKVTVPSVVDMYAEDALARLSTHGLSGEVTVKQFSESIPENIVIKQVPPAEQVVKEGRAVYLTISRGKQTIEVPSLIGRSVRWARIELMKRGLEMGEIQYDTHETYPRDTIIAQNIRANLSVPPGTKINITVSEGSEIKVPVPILFGVDLDEVEMLLNESGLNLGSITYQSSPTFLPNVVIETMPQQYELVPQGTAINIIVSK